MRAKEMRELSDEELLRRIEELKKELFNLRFQLVTGHVDNPMRVREVKRNIARAKTILRERELQRERAQQF